MEPGDLKQTPELFIADDFVKTAKVFQDELENLPPGEQAAFANLAIGVLGKPRTLLGAEHVFLGMTGQFVLRDTDNAVEYYHGMGSAYVEGKCANFAFMPHEIMGNLCLRLTFPHFIDPRESDLDLPVYDASSLNLYVPVRALETVLAA